MLSVIILGDPHLGKGINIGKQGIGSQLNSRVVDQINLLNWVFSKAIETSCGDIIITGDVFEEPKPDISLIRLFVSWLKQCESNSINVHIIMGNHDFVRSGQSYVSPLDIISEADFKGIYVYKDISTIFIKDCAFTLIPFRDRKSFNVNSNAAAIEILNSQIQYQSFGIHNNYHKIAIGHLAIEGSIPIGDEIDDIANELFCPISMFSNYDKTWMGHVHKYQVMSKSPYISHIGSMDISNFGETDQSKFIVIIDPETSDFYLEKIPTRTLTKMSITIPKDVKDTTTFVLNEIKKSNIDKSIVKIEISLDKNQEPIDKKQIETFLDSNGVFNIAGIFESKKSSIVKKDDNYLSVKTDVKSAIKTFAENYVDKNKKDKFIELALSVVEENKS